jgi:hypothetical protein
MHCRLFIGYRCRNSFWDEASNTETNEEEDDGTQQSKSETSSPLIQGYENSWWSPRQNHRAKAIEAPELCNSFFGHKTYVIAVAGWVVPAVGNPINYAKHKGDVCITRFVDKRYEERCDDQSVRNAKQVVFLVTNLPSDETVQTQGHRSQKCKSWSQERKEIEPCLRTDE